MIVKHSSIPSYTLLKKKSKKKSHFPLHIIYDSP